VTETALENLVSRYRADPIPTIRENRPPAGEIATRPRRHPYLFFDAESRDALRDRAKAEPYADLARRIRAEADAYLLRPIPPIAKDHREVIPRFLPDGSWNREWLKTIDNSDTYVQSYLIKDILPKLGFAYQLTGDARYGEAGRRWLLEFASRPLARHLTPSDILEGNFAFGMAIGYDWLHELLGEAEREQVRASLRKLAGPIYLQAKSLLARKDPQKDRATFGNNHRTRTNGLFGVLPLALIYETPEAREWLDCEIQLHRDRLYPSVLAIDGEYVDAWDHFDSSIQDPLPFVVALKHVGGEDLFANPDLAPRFRGISRYFLFGLEARCEELRGERRLDSANGFYWLALAREARDPIAQWIACADPRLRTVNNAVFAYLFYDPTVEAEEPGDPGSVYFPYSGMVKMCTDWGTRGTLVAFRCGAEIGKENGDQNSFRIRTVGEWTLPGSRWLGQRAPSLRPQDPINIRWDRYAWFWGSPAQNIVLTEPSGIGDAISFDRTGEMAVKGGVQFAQFPPVPGRVPRRGQWLSGPGDPKNGDLRAVHFSREVDYVCGEAHRAYVASAPTLWVRHIMVVKDPEDAASTCILVCDQIESDEPRSLAWQVRSSLPMRRLGHELRIETRGGRLEGRLLGSSTGEIVDKLTPAPIEGDREQFVQWRTRNPEKSWSYLSAFIATGKHRSEPRPSIRVVDADGGWAIELTRGGVTHLALFRREGSEFVGAGAFRTEGTAALMRRDPDGVRRIIMGKP